MNTFITAIVPASAVDTYRALAAAWSTGAGMFQTPLTADGSTISHYISTGMIDAQVAALLDDPAAFVVEFNAMTGATYTAAEMQALRAAMDLTAESPPDAMTRLGLSLYQEGEEI